MSKKSWKIHHKFEDKRGCIRKGTTISQYQRDKLSMQKSNIYKSDDRNVIAHNKSFKNFNHLNGEEVLLYGCYINNKMFRYIIDDNKCYAVKISQKNGMRLIRNMYIESIENHVNIGNVVIDLKEASFTNRDDKIGGYDIKKNNHILRHYTKKPFAKMANRLERRSRKNYCLKVRKDMRVWYKELEKHTEGAKSILWHVI